MSIFFKTAISKGDDVSVLCVSLLVMVLDSRREALVHRVLGHMLTSPLMPVQATKVILMHQASTSLGRLLNHSTLLLNHHPSLVHLNGLS